MATSRVAGWWRVGGERVSGGSSIRGETLSLWVCGGATGDGVYAGVARVMGVRFT